MCLVLLLRALWTGEDFRRGDRPDFSLASLLFGVGHGSLFAGGSPQSSVVSPPLPRV